MARDGSFTAAARSLAVTKQSVSERIARLEAGLGVQLVIRSTRALRLTDAGQQYASACAAIVAHAEAADRAVQQSQQRVTGLLRVTAPIGLGAILMFPVVREFRLLHPGVRVEVILEERVADLVRESIDLAVRAGSVASTPSFVARPLFTTDGVFVASPDYLQRHGRPRDAAELAAHACIAMQPRSTWRIDGRSVPIEAQVIVNTSDVARDAALAGTGIAQIPIPIVFDDIRAGRLEVLFGRGRHITISALWPTRRLALRARLFLDLLVRRAATVGEAQLDELPPTTVARPRAPRRRRGA
ncbi:MAG TPA: LysR family transcriptional regulator [Kofleriaceae bacterium]|nr:LysR family transcriptional regulator [Kofleriaceae bacterium]